MSKSTTVAKYIKQAPKIAQPKLRELRAIFKSVAPKAKESLKWGSPVVEGKRIYFAYAAFASHINFMPTPSVLKKFAKELATYKTGKGTVQLPYDKRIPKGLIRRMAAWRVKDVEENDARWM